MSWLCSGDGQLDVWELNGRANRLARALLARGLGREGVVAAVTEQIWTGWRLCSRCSRLAVCRPLSRISRPIVLRRCSLVPVVVWC